MNQLKIEFYKLKTFPLFYVMILLLATIGFSYGFMMLAKMPDIGSVFSEVVCDTSLVILVSVAASWFVGADFGNRTVTNELKLGYSRFSVIAVRAVAVCIVSVILHFTYIVSTIIGYSVVNGFDAALICQENVFWLFTVFLQIMAVESGVVMICFVMRKAAGAISVSLVYTLVSCNILRSFTDADAFTFSCFCFAKSSAAGQLIPCAVSAAAMIAMFLFASSFLFRKADIR